MAATARRLAVRPARRPDAEAVARIHVRAWEETYRGLAGPAAFGPHMLARRRRQWSARLARPAQAGGLWVAEAEGEPVGFGLCGPQREDDRPAEGEIYALYLLRRAQGLGLGRRLMETMAAALLDAGCATADLWALEANARASGFYRALGGRPEARRTFRLGGRPVVERAFVWDDLAAAFPNAQGGRRAT